MVLRHAHCLRSVRGNTHAMKDLFSAKARTLPGTSGQTRLRMPPDRWMPGPVSDPQYAPVDAQNRFPPQGIRRSSLKRRCPVFFRQSSRPQLPRKSEALRRMVRQCLSRSGLDKPAGNTLRPCAPSPSECVFQPSDRSVNRRSHTGPFPPDAFRPSAEAA